MPGANVQFPWPSNSLEKPSQGSQLQNSAGLNEMALPRTRKRSPSKTQSNYHPINSTPLSLLKSQPNPRNTYVDEQPQTGNPTLGTTNNEPATSSSFDTTKEVLPPTLQTFVHVVKLASFEKPDEYLKILAIPEAPESLKIGRQNMPKATNKITDGFFDSRVLSRSHAEMFVHQNQLYIKDLKSSNGTFINDKKLEPYKDYPLKVGDKLDLGTTLESQIAHKKITCTIADFNYVSLQSYQNFVRKVLEKDDLAAKRLKLFNSTVDALIFGELVDEREEENSLSNLLGDDNEEDDDSEAEDGKKDHSHKKKDIRENEEFVPNLNVKPSSSMQDIIRKLAIAVNNEYIQQQHLVQMNGFLKNYNSLAFPTEDDNSIIKNYKEFKKYLVPRDISRNEARTSLVESQRSNQALEKDLTAVRSELLASSKKVSELNHELNDYRDIKDQAHKLQDENTNLQDQITDYKASTIEHIHRISQLESQISTLQKKQQDLEKHAAIYQRSLEKEKSENTEVSRQLKEKNRQQHLIDKQTSTTASCGADKHSANSGSKGSLILAIISILMMIISMAIVYLDK